MSVSPLNPFFVGKYCESGVEINNLNILSVFVLIIKCFLNLLAFKQMVSEVTVCSLTDEIKYKFEHFFFTLFDKRMFKFVLTFENIKKKT